MSLHARRELLSATAERYQQARKQEKQKILDEFVAATSYHRKYAIRVLVNYTAQPKSRKKQTRRRKRVYDDAVKEALRIIWEAANRICSKRLVPFLPEIVPVLERHGHLKIDAECREKLLKISPATVDRLLYKIRHPRGLSTTKPGKLLKNQIPIRTFNDWDEQKTGFVEADLVAHCGNNVRGTFLCTLTMTDVVTGWTECFPLLWRDHNHVLLAIGEAAEQFPFPILGIDTDNGSEFINYALLEHCQSAEITFTRCRPYRKNDQCFVEQKNGAIVRHFVGYDRFEGWAPYRLLGELYTVVRLYVNFFQPSLKLVAKKRVEGKVRKRYDQAQSPYQRVLAAEILAEDTQDALKTVYQALDPVVLLRQIRELQKQLWALAYCDPSTAAQKQVATFSVPETPACTATLSADSTAPAQKPREPAENEGLDLPERQVGRRTKPQHGLVGYKRTWRTRKDPFADVWDEVEQQLEQNPLASAKMLFQQLKVKYPWKFTGGQLRTLQRRVQTWRLQYAQRIRDERHTTKT